MGEFNGSRWLVRNSQVVRLVVDTIDRWGNDLSRLCYVNLEWYIDVVGIVNVHIWSCSVCVWGGGGGVIIGGDEKEICHFENIIQQRSKQ